MVWSNGQEDDGLEPVVGAEQVQAAGGPMRPMPRTESELPQAPPPPPTLPATPRSRRSSETTLILVERQVDTLRQEILRQKEEAARKRLVQLLLWVGLGALAVGLGAAVSYLFVPDASVSQAEAPAPSGSSPLSSAPLSSATSSTSAPSAAAPGLPPSPAAASPVASAHRTLRLDELPAE